MFMRYLMAVVVAAIWSASALASSMDAVSVSRARSAAAGGDQSAAAALANTLARERCMMLCTDRGIGRSSCTNSCRAGRCYPQAGSRPYCVK